MNIPNVLTVIRFMIAPVFGYFLYNKQYEISVVLFLLSGLTDVLDGYIARRFNMVTSWGKLADPAADKLMQLIALILLTIQGKIPPVILIIILAKESFMGMGSILLLKKENVVVQANWYGKATTVVFHLAIIMIIFDVPYNNIFIFIAVIAAIYSFLRYSFAYRRIRVKN